MKAVQPPPEPPLDGVVGGLYVLGVLFWIFAFFLAVVGVALVSGLVTTLVFGVIHLFRRRSGS